MSFPHTQQERSAYLRRCALISVQKRWPYALIVGVIIGITAGALFPGLLVIDGLAALVTSLLVLAGIALNSMQRHANDI